MWTSVVIVVYFCIAASPTLTRHRGKPESVSESIYSQCDAFLCARSVQCPIISCCLHLSSHKSHVIFSENNFDSTFIFRWCLFCSYYFYQRLRNAHSIWRCPFISRLASLVTLQLKYFQNNELAQVCCQCRSFAARDRGECFAFDSIKSLQFCKILCHTAQTTSVLRFCQLNYTLGWVISRSISLIWNPGAKYAGKRKKNSADFPLAFCNSSENIIGRASYVNVIFVSTVLYKR